LKKKLWKLLGKGLWRGWKTCPTGGVCLQVCSSPVIQTFGPKPLKRLEEEDFWKQLAFELFSKKKKFGEFVLIRQLIV